MKPLSISLRRKFGWALLVLVFVSVNTGLSLAAHEASDELEEQYITPLKTDRKTEKTVKKVLEDKKKDQPFDKEFKGLVEMGPPAILPLLDFASHDKHTLDQRWTAIRAVGKIGDHRAVPGLLVCLKDPFPMMRMAALRALGDLKAEETLPQVSDVAEKDPALLVRNTAVYALGQMKSRQAIPTLERVFYDEKNFIQGQSIFIRRNVVVAMGSIQERAGAPLLIKALDDRDTSIPPLAVESLEKITRVKFAPKVKPAVSVNDQWKTWWQEELKRIPVMPAKETTEEAPQVGVKPPAVIAN